MTETGFEKVPARDRRRFPGISSRAYEHPADRSALVALRKLSGFDTVFKALSGLLPERSLRLLFLSESVRVGETQFPHLYEMLRDACYILDLEKVPQMYVQQDPKPNAMCIGLDEPIIVVTTGLVELLDEEEMRAVVGHEVGHALSGHAVYRTILLFLTGLALKVAWIPLGNVAIMTIVTALREWFRKSELSADRAGLLVGQDVNASMRGLMKIAGGNHLHEMNVDSFLAQAEEYESSGDLRDSVLKILNVLPRTHPFTTVRAAELKKWSQNRDYQRIMDGHYRGATRTRTPRCRTPSASRPRTTRTRCATARTRCSSWSATSRAARPTSAASCATGSRARPAAARPRTARPRAGLRSRADRGGPVGRELRQYAAQPGGAPRGAAGVRIARGRADRGRSGPGQDRAEAFGGLGGAVLRPGHHIGRDQLRAAGREVLRVEAHPQLAPDGEERGAVCGGGDPVAGRTAYTKVWSVITSRTSAEISSKARVPLTRTRVSATAAVPGSKRTSQPVAACRPSPEGEVMLRSNCAS